MKVVDNESQIWNRISEIASAENHFLRKEWFDAWTIFNDTGNNWCKEISYQYLSDSHDHHAILPYSFQKIGPFKFASLAGNFFPYRAIPNTGIGVELINKVADYVAEFNGIYGIRFGSITKSDEFISKLISCLKDRGWKITNTTLGYEYGMTVPSNEKEYLESISSKRRKKIRYYGKKLAECGKVEFNFLKVRPPIPGKKYLKI